MSINHQPGQQRQAPPQRPPQQKQQPKDLAVVEYESMSGKVKLSPQIIKRYLVSGDEAAANKVTDQEVMMFLSLCKYRQLNPFLREAYLIKFGNSPASIVVSKDLFTKRAAACPLCQGWEAGVVVLTKDGDLAHRNGTLVIKALGEILVGGWAKVHRKDWKNAMEIIVSLEEYQRFKNNGEMMVNWRKMPGTMIRKVALTQALREALPEEFGGMYSPEEMSIDDATINNAPFIDTDVVENESLKQFEQQFEQLQNGFQTGDKTTHEERTQEPKSTTQEGAVAGKPRMDEDTVNLLEDLYSKLSDYAYAKEFDDGVFKSAAENVICEYMRIDNISQAASSLLKGVLRSINTVTQKAEVLYQEWIAQQSSTESTDSTDNAQE